MNSLQQSLHNYVMLRRSLGFKFREQERALRQFVSFMNERRTRGVTTQLAYEWATALFDAPSPLGKHPKLAAYWAEIASDPIVARLLQETRDAVAQEQANARALARNTSPPQPLRGFGRGVRVTLKQGEQPWRTTRPRATWNSPRGACRSPPHFPKLPRRCWRCRARLRAPTPRLRTRTAGGG